MRNIWLATAAIAALASATPAAAQRVWQDGRWISMPRGAAPRTVQPVGRPHHIDPRPGAPRHDRWRMHNGRWRAGWDAPGGWNNYRRLGRGARIDRYWMDYRIPDYLSFGLAAPPRGYSWVRYYDDAVLVDDHGQVWDSVGGVGWGGGYASAAAGGAVAVASPAYAAPIAPVDPDVYYDDAPGYDAPPLDSEPYDDGYEPPIAPPVAPPPPVHVQTYPGAGYQAGTFLGGNAYAGSSYYSSGYGYAGGTTTTVIINPAPVVTTTTVTEEVVTYTQPAKRILRKTLKRYPRKRCTC